MTVDRPNDRIGHKDTGSHPAADPIARNDKDVNSVGGIHPADVTRCDSVPTMPTTTAIRPGDAWGVSQRLQAGASAGEMLASVLRFKWTLVFVSLLVSVPIVAGVWIQIVPRYRARAEVRVKPFIPRLVFRTDENGQIPFYESFVNTQVSLARSLTVLQRVLDQKEVQETQWYEGVIAAAAEQSDGGPTYALEVLRDSLEVRPRHRTEIIDVSLLGKDPHEAKIIVDAAVKQYIDFTTEEADATKDEIYRQLQEQHSFLEKEIIERELACAKLHKALGTEMPQELIASRRVRLDESEANLRTLQQRIALLEWEAERTATADTNDPTAVPVARAESQPPYHEDAEWLRFTSEVAAAELAIANSVYKPKHHGMVQLTKNLEFAKESVRLREAQLDEQWRNRPPSVGLTVVSTVDAATTPASTLVQPVSLEHELARAVWEEEMVRKDVEVQRTEFQKLFEEAQLLTKENNDLAYKRQLFEAVRQRLDQKTMERNVPGSIEVLMWAFCPSQPDADRRMAFTGMALAFGLAAGSGAAFLRASRNQTIGAFKDMPQPMQVPFLGRIPLIRTRIPLGRSLYDEIEQNQFLLVESIRVLRTTLLSQLGDKRSATVLVTSANEGTGKSSTTMMLGKSIAQAGRKVLMIDADFYRMTLSKRFDLLDRPGFMDSLSCRAIDKRHIFPTKTLGLSVMPAGTRADEGVVFEEIANAAFGTCMDQLTRQYDYDIILLDSAPILPVADATILAGQVYGTIMVEREHLSRRANVANALARLSSTGGRLLGTVFIGSGGREDYGYGYGHYHNRSRES